jgi:hypothetical protein
VAERELPGAADLLGERAARRRCRCDERPEPDTGTPQHERDERERQHHHRTTALPEQHEQ